MAGVNYAIKKAFDKYSDRYQLRQVRGTDNYIKYPHDITWMGNNSFVNRLYDESDLIHISEYPWALDGGSAPKIWNKVRKPTVVHQHGTPFRADPRKFSDLARRDGFTQIVSTVDLTLLDPNVEWLPNPVDIEMMQQIRLQYKVNDGIIRFGQAPTNQAIKNTKEYVHAVRSLKDEYPVDYLVIEKQTWDTTLREKARCDIWFDQLTFGYGNNGIEAGAMGMPVVGGFCEPAHEEALVAAVGEVPFVRARSDNLAARLRELAHDSAYRAREGARAFAYMQRVHGERSVVAALEKIYDRTINEFEAKHGRI